MKRQMAVAVLLVFAATTAVEAQSRSRGGSSGGRSGGGRSSGGGSVSRGMSPRGGGAAVSRYSGVRPGRSYSGARSYAAGRSYSGGGYSGARAYSGARSYSGARTYSGAGSYAGARSYSSGSRYSSGGSQGSSYYGGRAVPRGSAGYTSRSSAQSRHPRVGYGTGYSHGYGSHYGGYGHGHYGHGHRYGYGYAYPYYGYAPYYPYGYSPYYGSGLGVGLSFYYGGSPSVGVYAAAPYDAGYVSAEPYAGGGGASYAAVEYADRGAPREEGAELRLVVLPEDASVWIDNEFRGTARAIGQLMLAPGRHQVEVVRPGYRSALRDVDLRPGAPTSLRIELERP